MCDDLAALATALEKAAAEVQAAIADAIVGTGASVLAREIAGRFVEQVAAGPADQVTTIVRGIRVCGVVLCAVGGRDLERCLCRRVLVASVCADVADAAVEAGVEHALRHGLEPFLQASAVP